MSENQFEPLLKQFADLVAQSVINKIPDFKKDLHEPKEDEALLTREEACNFLRINSSTLWDWTNKGRVKAFGLGSRRYYKKSQLLNSLIELKK
jgi:hypothetical protein